MGRETVLDVDKRDRVLLEDERVLTRQVAEQQHLGVDALLLQTEDEGGAGADRVAVGADVGGDQYALRAGQGFDDPLVAIVHAGDDMRLMRRERLPATARRLDAARRSQGRARSAP